MKGRSPSAAEKAFHDALCRKVGCIACRKEGRFNTWVSVHHITGRTSPQAHWNVLPLCGAHHQDMGAGVVAVHPWKTRFEALYGNQFDLLDECIKILEEE